MASVNKTETAAVIFLLLTICAVGFSSTSITELKAAVCGFTEPYKTADLEQPKAWSLNYTDNSSLCIGSNNETISCNFLFAFCHPYNCSTTDRSLMNSSACLEMNNKNTSTSKTYKLGAYNDSVNPFEVSSSGAKFVVHFLNGSSYKTADNKSCSLLMDMTFTCKQNGLWKSQGQGQTKVNKTLLRSIRYDRYSCKYFPKPFKSCSLLMDMTFTCNQNGLWRSQGQGQTKVNKTLLRSIRYDRYLCKYYLEFDYDGACPVITPVQPITIDTSLSAGSVLIIIFFVGISVYCILGGTIKCLQGNRGKEIIPNSNFWVMLPVYIADGFIYTCEKCCCFNSRSDSDRRYDRI